MLSEKEKRPLTERERAIDMIRHIAAAYGIGLEPNVWYKPDERLPETGEGVLVIISGQPCKNITFERAKMLAEYYDGDGWVITDYPDWEDAHPELWRNLPTAPVEWKNENQ